MSLWRWELHRYLFFVSQSYSYAILRPLQAEIIKRGGRVAWFLYGSEIDKKYLKQDEFQLTNVEEIIDFNPVATFTPENMIPNFIPGLKVGLFHGFNAGKINRRGKEDHFNIRGCFDLYCTQGPNTTTRFKQLADELGHFNVVETGWSALDPLFRCELVEAGEQKTVLMCSTFSRNLSCAPHLFEQIKRLSRSGRWRWLIQFHPKMNQEIVKQYRELEGEHLKFVETDDIIPLLQQGDVMLCDTSSVLLMFILQGKPVVSFKNKKPGPYLIDFDQPDQLEQHLEQALSHPKNLMQNIEEFNLQLHPNRDGYSSGRVLDAVEIQLADKKILSASKPLNILRNLKFRKKLKYWKFW